MSGLHANGKRCPLCPPDKQTAEASTGSVADRIEQAIAAVLGNPADTDYPNAANLTRAVMDALQVPDEEDLAGLRGSLLLLAEDHDARGLNSYADLLRTAEGVIRLQRIREQALLDARTDARWLLALIDENEGRTAYSMRAQHMMAEIERRYPAAKEPRS